MKQNGLKADELKVSDAAILDIIRYYTREAGVRNLEREIAKICRKAVKQTAAAKPKQGAEVRVRGRPSAQSRQVPGRAPVPLRQGRGEEPRRPGHRSRLDRSRRRAADHRGGVVPGKGKLQHTGQLGEVMQESIQAAMTVVRSRASVLGIDAGVLPEARRAPAHARRRDAEGRPERRHRHVHGAGLGAHQDPGALATSR